MPVRLTLPTALVLHAISSGVQYGFDIMDATGLPSGTVYPMLRRLEDAGLLRAKWEAVREARDDGRPPRRYYQITGVGLRVLADARERFPALSRAISGDDPVPA